MYKCISSLSIILAFAACSANSQPETVAVNAGDAAVPTDVGYLTASKGHSGQFGQPATVSLPHVEPRQLEIAMASPAGEARVQQPGSVSPNLSETHDESSLVPQALNAVAANDANTDASGAGAAAARPLDLSLDYQPGLASWSPDDWFGYVPGDTSAKGFIKGFDASALFNRRADNQDQELSFSFVPTLKPGQEFAWTSFPELDGGSVNFEVKTR